MFRISQYMRHLVGATPPRQPLPSGAAPVVIWNLVRRCNLACRHCYALSANRDFAGELSRADIEAVMADLQRAGVRVLILSGGEPLLHPDLYALSRHAKTLGFHVGLSSNGTLIDAAAAEAIAAVGYDYVGVSLDGIGATHDRFRGKAGAFDAALAGIRRLHRRGIKVGLRFTMTQDNAAELPLLLDLLEREGLDKFYFSHLNYAGRGNRNRRDDAGHESTRRAMELLFERCLALLRRGEGKEFVSGNNDADAVYFLLWLERRYPAAVAPMAARLARWGGNASGIGVANIDNRGEVHPDTMWPHLSLGNVRERPFAEIWADGADPMLTALRQRPRPVGGRCAACAWLSICNGNSRVRAFQVAGDHWAEDPGCYLTDDEIGAASAARLATCNSKGAADVVTR